MVFFQTPLGKIAAVVAIAMTSLMVWVIDQKQSKLIEDIEAMSEINSGGDANKIETNRLKEIRSLQYKEPQQALQIIEGIVQNPESEAELEAANDFMPQVLQNCFLAHLKSAQFVEAEAYLDRLNGEYPDSLYSKSSQRKWGEKLRGDLTVALDSKQWEVARTLFERITSENLWSNDRWALERYQEAHSEAWTAAQERGDPAAAEIALEEAAKVWQDRSAASLVRALSKSNFEIKLLLRKASEWESAGKTLPAANLYRAAFSLNRERGSTSQADYVQRQQIDKLTQERLVAQLLQAGSETRALSRPIASTLDEEEFCRQALRFAESPALQHAPLQRLFEIKRERFDQNSSVVLAFPFEPLSTKNLSKNQVDEIYRAAQAAQGDAQNASKAAIQLWQSYCLDEQFDPWAQLEPHTRKLAVERSRGSNDEKRLRNELSRMAQEGMYPIPIDGVEVIKRKLCETTARFGVLAMHSSAEAGLRELHEAFDLDPDEETIRDITRSLQTLIDRSLENSKFEDLYDLAVFTVSEIGLSRLDKLQQTRFTESMQAAKTGISSNSNLELAFVESILADTGDAAALESAFQYGFRAARLGTIQVDNGDQHQPSRLPSMSSISVDNGTDHMLLCFYDGPERFYLRFPPRSRSSIVLRNGQWKIAVLAPDRGIQALEQKANLDNVHKPVIYTIESSNATQEKRAIFGPQRGRGTYALARSPENLSGIQVDESSGIPAL